MLGNKKHHKLENSQNFSRKIHNNNDRFEKPIAVNKQKP